MNKFSAQHFVMVIVMVMVMVYFKIKYKHFTGTDGQEIILGVEDRIVHTKTV